MLQLLALETILKIFPNYVLNTIDQRGPIDDNTGVTQRTPQTKGTAE